MAATPTPPPTLEARRARTYPARMVRAARGVETRIQYLERYPQVLSAGQRDRLRALAESRAET